MERLTTQQLDALEAALKAPETMGPGEFLQRIGPFLYHLPALIAAARATVPEVIGEKHKQGDWWLVWDKWHETWRKARWSPTWESWQNSGGSHLTGFLTHALPLPPAPEAPDVNPHP
jgi:hypothetical protein